jgi:membrane associated rhomboid family serine protease
VPFLTISIILINLFIFINEVSLGLDGMEELFYIFGLVPAQFREYSQTPIGYIPFFSSMFLHGSWVHLIGNMWILWLFGDNVEDHMGKGRFLLFYIICGLAAGYTHYVINPNATIPVVGASGAVAGIMGAYFLMFKHAKVLTFVPPFFLFNLPAWIYLGLWAFTQLWCGTTDIFLANNCGQIAFWAHIGGFFTGMCLYRFFIKPESKPGY